MTHKPIGLPWAYDRNHGVIHGIPRYPAKEDVPAGYEGNGWNTVARLQHYFNYDESERSYDSERQDAHARIILRGINNYEGLLAACREALKALKGKSGASDKRVARLLEKTIREAQRDPLEKIE